MSNELSTAAEPCEELCGVDGGGLGEGEVACEAELSWCFFPLGVLEGGETGLREAGGIRRRGRTLEGILESSRARRVREGRGRECVLW